MSAQAEASTAVAKPVRRWFDPSRKDGGTTGAGLDLLRVVGHLVLHDVTVPGHFGLVLDHVIAGPSGVYVVTMISHSGHLTITEDLLVVDRTPLNDAVSDAADAASAVRGLLGSAPVVPLLCFDRTEDLSGVVGGVAVCSAENVLELLNGQPPMLEPVRQREITRILTDTLVRAVGQSATRSAARTAVRPVPSTRQAAAVTTPAAPVTPVPVVDAMPTVDVKPAVESKPRHRDRNWAFRLRGTMVINELTAERTVENLAAYDRPVAKHAARPFLEEVLEVSGQFPPIGPVWTPAPAGRVTDVSLVGSAPAGAEVQLGRQAPRLRVMHSFGLAVMMTGAALFAQALFLR